MKFILIFILAGLAMAVKADPPAPTGFTSSPPSHVFAVDYTTNWSSPHGSEAGMCYQIGDVLSNWVSIVTWSGNRSRTVLESHFLDLTNPPVRFIEVTISLSPHGPGWRGTTNPPVVIKR
jgi:hypothetical protein